LISQPRSLVLDGAPCSPNLPGLPWGVHGPKTDSSNAFTPWAGLLLLGRSLRHIAKALGGAAPWAAPPSFSAHVRPTASRGRLGEHGAPVQGRGLSFLLPPLRTPMNSTKVVTPNLISYPQAAGSVLLINRYHSVSRTLIWTALSRFNPAPLCPAVSLLLQPALLYGRRGAPLSAVLTGAARPMKTTRP